MTHSHRKWIFEVFEVKYLSVGNTNNLLICGKHKFLTPCNPIALSFYPSNSKEQIWFYSCIFWAIFMMEKSKYLATCKLSQIFFDIISGVNFVLKLQVWRHLYFKMDLILLRSSGFCFHARLTLHNFCKPCFMPGVLCNMIKIYQREIYFNN